MATHTLEVDVECTSCGGTGLYVGLGERDGAAVVCSRCHGTGCARLVVTYTDFKSRKKRDDVRRVYRANPGIVIGEGNDLTLDMFGGMDYEQWEAGEKFPEGSEDRLHTCPAWWYQSADYEKQPEWHECRACGLFSSCTHFDNKAECWERWDHEYGEEEE